MNEAGADRPFVYRRRVHWGDNDPAGIVYTPRFHDFIMEAIEAWLREIVDIDWYRLSEVRKMGAPFVHTGVDYFGPVRAGDLLEIRVLLERLGRSSIVYDLNGSVLGDTRFRARLVCTTVTREPYRSVPIPEDLRAKMEPYLERWKELVAPKKD